MILGTIEYGEKETEYLSRRDGKLGKYIKKLGFVERKAADDLFSGLCYNIINQQLSMKAADTLFEKVRAAIGEIVPKNLRSAERLFGCGLSHTKAECLALCAEKFRSGELSAERLSAMTDDEVTKKLTELRGIGEWTAEMTMIFCLGRRDVLSLSDYGIRKGLSILHGIDMKDHAEMRKYKKIYSPYGTAASVYLWEISKGELT